MSTISVRRNERGAWCVYVRGQFISDHRSRDGAVATARQLERFEQEDDGYNLVGNALPDIHDEWFR